MKEHADVRAKGENINDKIVTRYMDDKEFGEAAFGALSQANYDSIPMEEEMPNAG